MRYSFADCVLDSERHQLTRDGQDVHVEPQVFDLIELLLQRAGDLVTRDEIIEVVWEGRIVSDATISARINAARGAVGDTGQAQKIIRTVTRKGLQLVAEVSSDKLPAGTAAKPDIAAPRIAVRLTASKDGSGLAWSKSGEGPPLLRAGHWLTHLERDLTTPIWRRWIERMQAGRTLVRYDTRGTGMSGKECGPMSLEAFVDDLEAVADAARLDRFSIFSASQSTAVACAFAAKFPDRVERIFSWGGWPEGSRVRDATLGDTMTDAIHEMLRHGWGKPDGGQMRVFTSLMMPGASPEQVAAFVEAQINSADADTAIDIRDAISRFDVKDLLPDVRVPVCVAHSSQDAMHPVGQAQLLARLIPNAQLHIVESVNHILLEGEPALEQVLDLMDDFLSGELD